MRLVAFTLILLLAGWVAPISAQEANRAALVVVLGEGTAVSRCVEFAEAEINGLELINRSGLAMETGTASFGASVCTIDGTGCPGDDCFCQCKGGGDCVYWSYWHLTDGEWQYSQAGAAAYRVKDGMVEGWVWGPGSPQEAPEPPPITFDDVCDDPTAPVEGVEEAAPAGTAVPPSTEEPASSSALQWLGYGLFLLIVVGLGGLLLARGRQGV